MNDNYKFLENKPLGQDLFEGKSQEKIANVIAEIIENDKFKVIGIDGSWGTGKSNLVKIVDNQLPNHHFFVYDVWGHQEDEQRRSLLIELTNHLTNKKSKLVKKGKWENKLKILLSKKKEVTTENFPYLSVGFLFSLVALIYGPSVIAFKDELTNWLKIESIFWKLVLVLFPVLIVFGIYIFNLIKYWINNNGFWYPFKLAAQETFQIYNNKQKKETKIESISEEQPSVKDFQDWMTEIDNDLNGDLILVLDNFDRLPKKHILNIWSSIHVFFANKEYKNIKVILPFDRKHIKNAFSEMNGANNVDYADDYINKTFDIVFRVSPPILSSWKTFLKNNWKDAIKNFDESEYIKVEQLYEILKPKITPRDLLTFINNVVSIKLFDDSIPDRYIATFVLKKNNILEDPLRAITNLDYLGGVKYMFSDDDDYAKYITSLSYQIKPENALEVIYRKELKEALINTDKQKLLELSKTKVFRIILASVIREIENLNTTIESLNIIDDEANINSLELDNVWDIIYGKNLSISFKRQELEEHQLILLNKISSKNQEKWLGRILDNLYNYNKPDDFKSIQFVDAIDEIHSFCLDKNIKIDVFEHLKETHVNIDEFKTLIEYKEDKFKDYKLKSTREEVEKYLNTLDAKNINEAEFIIYLDYHNELSNFHDKLKNFISGKENDISYLKKIYNLLKNTTKSPINNPLGIQHLNNLATKLDIEDDFYVDVACMVISLNNQNQQNYRNTFEKVLSIDNKDFSKIVANNIEKYITLESLLLRSVKKKNKLIENTLPFVLNIRENNRELDIEIVLKNFVKIINTNNLDPELLFDELSRCDYGDFKYDFIQTLSVEFYDLTQESTSMIAKDIKNTFLSWYENGDSKVWDNAFKSLNSKELSVLQTLEFKKWNSYSLKSFYEKIISIIDSSEIIETSLFNKLINSFHKSDLNISHTVKDVRDYIIDKNNLNPNNFTSLIKHLIKFGSLEEKSSDVIRTIFKIEFLDNNECVEEMINHNTFITKLLDNATDDDKSNFIKAVNDRLKNDKIKNLARSIGIIEDNKKEA